METKNELRHIYVCTKHGRVPSAASPKEIRQATGRAARCPRCGEILFYKGDFTLKEEPKVNLALSTGEVLHLINLLELRNRTPEEENILQTCYKSKIKNETFQ